MLCSQWVATFGLWRTGLVAQLALSLGFSAACDSNGELADMRVSALQSLVDIKHVAVKGWIGHHPARPRPPGPKRPRGPLGHDGARGPEG
eukprot:TRINITY_DN16891_c0_g1_i2.p3 TRINITY_DN16891_c0_g1~~TRINITY_DN16891_c0_g1_i2.p3  ORF type:complete len:100 (-),score=10.92 TRINITY_DN16891_c0_g1_i2:181-450(-)